MGIWGFQTLRGKADVDGRTKDVKVGIYQIHTAMESQIVPKSGKSQFAGVQMSGFIEQKE